MNELNMQRDDITRKKISENKWKEKISRKTLQFKRTIEEKINKQLKNLDYMILLDVVGSGGWGGGGVEGVQTYRTTKSCFFLSSHDLKTFEIHVV